VVQVDGTIVIELRMLLDEDSDDDFWEEDLAQVEAAKEEPKEKHSNNKKKNESDSGSGSGSLLSSLLFEAATEEGEEGAPSDDEDDAMSSESDNSFGYKAIERREVQLPHSYMELQMRFISAFPKHDASLAVERFDGTTVKPTETKFVKNEIIVFREFQPMSIAEKKQKKVQGHKSRWEEEVYEQKLANFELKTWEIL